MTDRAKTVTVSRDQVSAARALVQLHGGLDKVDPVIAKALPRNRVTRDSKAS